MFDFLWKITRRRHRRYKKTRRQRKLSGGQVVDKMNCSPIVDKISVTNSCYTPQVLFKIRDEYNKSVQNADDKITETDPTKLWKILNATFTSCEREDCWLNTIPDEKLRKQIDRYLFAPDKPYEWKKNPLEWLSNYDILNVLEQYEEKYKEFEFIGPTPIDFDKVVRGKCVWEELCKFNLRTHLDAGKKKIGIIFNLSPHTSSGSHWVSLFIDTEERFLFYFDSAGSKIPSQINALKKRIMKQTGNAQYRFIQNAPKTHQRGNTECGVYSLFFIITMLTGVVTDTDTKAERKLTADERIHLFTKETIPDKYMEKRRNIYFND